MSVYSDSTKQPICVCMCTVHPTSIANFSISGGQIRTGDSPIMRWMLSSIQLMPYLLEVYKEFGGYQRRAKPTSGSLRKQGHFRWKATANNLRVVHFVDLGAVTHCCCSVSNDHDGLGAE